MNNSIVHFQVNLTFILISCSIELVNNSLTLVCFSMIFVICIHPWPFKLAQVYLITFNALGFIICALGATISCLQILFVIKFSLVFSWNPLKIGRVTLLAVCFVTGIPNRICMWTFRHHSGNSHGAYCIFPVSDTDQTKFTEHLFFHKPSLAFWSIFLCLSLLSGILCYSPGYEQVHSPASWKLYVAGCLAVLSIIMIFADSE